MAGSNSGLTGGCSGPGCQHALPCLHTLSVGMHTAMEAGDQVWAGGVQVHKWRA